MNQAITEFMLYAGFPAKIRDQSGRLSMRLESGTTINVEPAPDSNQLIVSIFYPSPWKILELAGRALRNAHYRESGGKPIAVGIFEDRLVLATRLSFGHQSPEQIERAAQELCAFAEQCAQNPDEFAATPQLAFAAS